MAFQMENRRLDILPSLNSTNPTERGKCWVTFRFGSCFTSRFVLHFSKRARQETEDKFNKVEVIPGSEVRELESQLEMNA